jgi:hypothetical protein
VVAGAGHGSGLGEQTREQRRQGDMAGTMLAGDDGGELRLTLPQPAALRIAEQRNGGGLGVAAKPVQHPHLIGREVHAQELPGGRQLLQPEVQQPVHQRRRQRQPAEASGGDGGDTRGLAELHAQVRPARFPAWSPAWSRAWLPAQGKARRQRRAALPRAQPGVAAEAPGREVDHRVQLGRGQRQGLDARRLEPSGPDHGREAAQLRGPQLGIGVHQRRRLEHQHEQPEAGHGRGGEQPQQRGEQAEHQRRPRLMFMALHLQDIGRAVTPGARPEAGNDGTEGMD